jgi:hypothetical protein
MVWTVFCCCTATTAASYTDIHIALPVLWLLVGPSIIAALACWANLRVLTWKLPVAAAVLVFGSSLALALVFPALFQLVFVKPSSCSLRNPTSSATSTSPSRRTSPSDLGQTLPGGTESHLPDAAGQPGDD